MKQVLERPRLTWGECYSSLPLALYGATKYTRKRVYGLPEFLAHTTFAFRTSVNHEAFFTGAFDLQGLIGRTMDNLGVGVSIIHERNLEELSAELLDRALSMIRDSIGRGIPVIGHNLENYEYGLIYGYDDSEAQLYICDISAQEGKTLAYDQLGKRPLNGMPIGPELTLISLEDRPEVPQLDVNRSPEQDGSYRRTLARTLGFIIDHLTGEEPVVGGFEHGRGAFDAWIEAFRERKVHSIGNGYNIMLFTNARKFAIRFLLESSQPDFFRVHDARLQELMAQAAAPYTEAYAEWIALRHRFPFTQPVDTASPEVAGQAVRRLRRIQELEGKGLTLFQQMRDLLRQ